MVTCKVIFPNCDIILEFNQMSNFKIIVPKALG
jgi:hypothetical protein